jgi:Pectate lyase superfamily protein
MATSGLYGNSSESIGLYGNTNVFGGTYFQWFIFQENNGQPVTPTGGSWDFTTNTGTPPTGWTTTVASVPTTPVWFSTSFVDSRNPTVFVWSAPSLLTSSNSIYASAYAETFTGNGTQTVFTLANSPVTVNNTDVSINGVVQVPGVDYTINAVTLTTTTAVPNRSVMLVKYKQSLPNSYYGLASNVGFTPVGAITSTNVQSAIAEVVTDLALSSGSSTVGYLPAGTGAVATTVQTKLRESVSVKDFGAVGNGTTDDTAAIQAAIDYALSKYVRVFSGGGATFPAVMVKVIFPAGIYKTSGTLTMNTGGYATCVLEGEGQACIYYSGTGNAIYLRPIDPGLPLMTTPSQIRNLTFRGAGTKQGIAIYLETMTNGVIYNCNIWNFDTGIRISGAEAYDIDLCQQAIDTCNFGVIIEQSANQIRPNLCMIRNAYFISCSTKSVWIRNNGVGSGASGGVLSLRDINFQGSSTIALHVDTPGEIAGTGTVSVDRCWFEGYGSKAVYLNNGRITYNNCFFTNNGTTSSDTMLYLNDTVSTMDFYYCTFHASVTPSGNCHINITNPTVNYPYLSKNVTTERLLTRVDGIPAVLVGYNGTIGLGNSVAATQIVGVVSTASGITTLLAPAGYQDVYDLAPAGGGQFIVTGFQSDGGRVWKGFWTLSSDGSSGNTVTVIQSTYITVSTSGAMLRITNSHPTISQNLFWSIVRIA